MRKFIITLWYALALFGLLLTVLHMCDTDVLPQYETMIAYGCYCLIVVLASYHYGFRLYCMEQQMRPGFKTLTTFVEEILTTE